jgi:hypothetical protein
LAAGRAARLGDAPAGLLSVRSIPRRRRLRGRPQLHISEVADDGTEVFAEDPDNDAALTPTCRGPLAQTILTLGALLEPGWQLHVGWVGEGSRTQDVSADQLAEIARQSRFSSDIRYRVI